MKREYLKSKLKLVPDNPGIYLMKNAQGEVLYVGKAASLKPRLASYFQKSASLGPRLESLLAAVADFDYLVTDSELEALMLESVLIKKHRPKYNVILKDDKHYPYLKLTIEEEYPRLAIVRRVEKDGCLYFGPYVPTKALRQTLRLIYDIFPLRHCVYMNPRQGRPCINYQLQRCSAPCFGLINATDYAQIVAGVKLFLQGKNNDLLGLLKRQMGQASAELRYERAARLRDQITAVKRVMERQKIISSRERVEQDVVALAREAESACFQVFFIRHGMLTGHKHLMLEHSEQAPDEELISSFLLQFYAEQQRLPSIIIIPRLITHQPLLEEWLSRRRGSRVRVIVPRRGEKYRLLAMAHENARLQLVSYQRQQEKSPAILVQAKQDLGLKHLPRRIEAFDISNIQGDMAVGSLVVWEGNGFRKDDYRRFNIKGVTQVDDYAMLAEVLSRRYSRLVKEGQSPPDLILVDGGKGQLNIALGVLRHLQLEYIPVLGLAKREEDIFLPGQQEPLKLPSHSSTRQLLQRIRDEAHRFAIHSHRQRRSRKTLTSKLSGIPGVGPQRQQALLRHFGSLTEIKKATFQELEQLPFLNRKVAREIFNFFHSAGG
jgi:excinuclease ABC subunit C